MIETTMKKMITGLGLVAGLGGCGENNNNEPLRIEEVCGIVTRYTVTEKGYEAIECIDEKTGVDTLFCSDRGYCYRTKIEYDKRTK